eukprot:CAMPEP_0115503550 /NCGR_PEP_ID=MMETSP0271-20121206/69539_1 /TAXON_ID=71861 /ORGANISM="Scrippsiella trochoidea, Strain CCMP3099" /LENGTH=337 /DNA_ID=CAMNT_0002932655 /DNA_START=71 /DNA_END=1083 /DNA_ORIENTATION=-
MTLAGDTPCTQPKCPVVGRRVSDPKLPEYTEIVFGPSLQSSDAPLRARAVDPALQLLDLRAGDPRGGLQIVGGPSVLEPALGSSSRLRFLDASDFAASNSKALCLDKSFASVLGPDTLGGVEYSSAFATSLDFANGTWSVLAPLVFKKGVRVRLCFSHSGTFVDAAQVELLNVELVVRGLSSTCTGLDCMAHQRSDCHVASDGSLGSMCSLYFSSVFGDSRTTSWTRDFQATYDANSGAELEEFHKLGNASLTTSDIGNSTVSSSQDGGFILALANISRVTQLEYVIVQLRKTACAPADQTLHRQSASSTFMPLQHVALLTQIAPHVSGMSSVGTAS